MKPKNQPLGLWRYSVRWRLRHLPPPGPIELASAEVPAGTECPVELMRLKDPGDGYGICIDFINLAPIKRWSPERKAAVRQKRMKSRIEKSAPLFLEEFIHREMATRPEYYAGR